MSERHQDTWHSHQFKGLAFCCSLYILPFIFTPNLVYNLHDDPRWLIYLLSAINGFVLMSLYNLQELLENPFDQMGLDDIKLNEFEFADPAPSP